MSQSMCELQREQDTNGRSLGAFQPAEISDLAVVPALAEWTKGQAGLLGQASFIHPERKELEPLPIKAKYQYRCSDPSCGGHDQSIIDWEVGQLYRRLIESGESDEAAREKVRAKFFDEIAGEERDTIFIAGNMAARRANFLILGVVYPKRSTQEGLF